MTPEDFQKTEFRNIPQHIHSWGCHFRYFTG